MSSKDIDDPVIQKQDRITFTLKVSGADNVKNINFNINMLGQNSLIKTSTVNPRIYFTDEFQYSDTLLRNANVPINPATFVVPTLFLRLLRYGIRTRKSNTPTTQDNNEKKNIDYIIDLFFKKTAPIYLRKNKFIISRISSKNIVSKKLSKESIDIDNYNKTYKGTKENIYMKYNVSLHLDILKDTGSLSWVDYERKPCKEKLKEIKKDLGEIFGITTKGIKSNNDLNIKYKNWGDYYPNRVRLSRTELMKRRKKKKQLEKERKELEEAHREALIRKEMEKIKELRKQKKKTKAKTKTKQPNINADSIRKTKKKGGGISKTNTTYNLNNTRKIGIFPNSITNNNKRTRKKR